MSFYLKESAPKGLGTKVLYHQTKSLLSYNPDVKIVTYASRAASLNTVGYYVWPRLGYDGTIPLNLRKDLPPEFKDYNLVSDFMKTKEGREWWREHGASFTGIFDKNSLEILEQYIQEKAKAEGVTMDKWMKTAKKKEEETAEGKTKKDIETPPVLDETDDQILDRIWDEIGKKRK
jgi:hypothetical protein